MYNVFKNNDLFLIKKNNLVFLVVLLITNTETSS